MPKMRQSLVPDMSMNAVVEERNPKWLKPSMTIAYAAAQCQQRGYTFRARLDAVLGLTIIVTRPKRESDK